MVNTVKIFLDNYINDVCYPGQTLSGRVECFFDKQKKIRGIRLKFKGRAKTKWSRKQGKNNVTYTGEEIYFNQEYNLVQGSDEEFYIDAGQHSYPFSYILPQSLPSSFEGEFGRVKYAIKVTVDRPWAPDYEEKVILNVYSPLDLNTVPELQLYKPYATSVGKQVSRGCCSSDPLTFNISVPATGFAMGQDINIGAFIQNLSNVTVELVEFSINQVIQFIAHSPRTREKCKELTITTCSAGAVGAHAEKSWTSILNIPREYYPNLLPCSIINITYHIRGKVILPFLHSNLKCEFPIIIGDLPLSGINMRLPDGPPPLTYLSNYNNATAPPGSSFPAASSSSAAVDISYPPDVYMPTTVPKAHISDM